MALLQVDFFSEVLGMCTQMSVILPQRTRRQIGMTGAVREGKYPAVFLLHGMTDDHTTWCRRTSIERYVSELGIAVVMPEVHLGWYTDTKYGMRYQTYISRELPGICREFFPNISYKKEDILAAGVSMGGYGAWKAALDGSENFGAGAALSGALDLAASLERHRQEEPEEQAFWNGIFGSGESVRGSDNDLWELAAERKATEKEMPRLYAWCGRQDFLYEDNLHTWEHMKELGIEVTVKESEGSHTWDCWDEQIQDVLKWWMDR